MKFAINVESDDALAIRQVRESLIKKLTDIGHETSESASNKPIDAFIHVDLNNYCDVVGEKEIYTIGDTNTINQSASKHKLPFNFSWFKKRKSFVFITRETIPAIVIKCLCGASLNENVEQIANTIVKNVI